MRVEHLAIDGSVVTLEADVDLSAPATTSGWAIVPSIMRPHPFTVYPCGHAERVQDAIRETGADVEVVSSKSYQLQGRELEVAKVEVPAGAGGRRRLTVGAWEGERGCLASSLTGHHPRRLMQMFETLRFSESELGLSIDSPVTADMRPPQLLKSVPELGVMLIRPAIHATLQSVPRRRGAAVEHGELFRFGGEPGGLKLVGRSAVVTMRPRGEACLERMPNLVENMRVEWKPSGVLSSC